MSVTRYVAEMTRQIRLFSKSLPSMMIVSVITLAVLGLTAWIWFDQTSLAQNQSNRERVETELVTIRPTGFEPAEISRVQGRFLLAVDNRAGLEEVTLRLDRVAGNRLRDVKVPRRKLDWREFVDLTPGRYVLSEAAHPEWNCTITITPK